MDVVRFAVLGLGAGAVYGLTALGIVVVYNGSGVLNFAQGAIGMIGAFVVYLSREHGVVTPIALGLGLGLGAAIGAAMHLLVMRPLRRAPAVSRLVASLGLLAVCLALGHELWGDRARLVAKMLPTDSVTLFGDVVVGKDRLLILGVAMVVTAALALLYRGTRFGLATSAVAESRRAAAAQGISPDVVATTNWALGGVLAVASAVLIVNITGLQVVGLTLLVVPALAAALVGGFRSFPFTLLGGLLIGVLESEIAYAQVKVGTSAFLQGAARSVPFLVIIAVLVVRGRALPIRDDATDTPELGTGIVRPSWAALLTVGALAFAALAPAGWVDALTTTAAVGVILLSLVVVTGFTGQLSLAQFALAGMGAWIAARLVVDYDVPFELAALAGIAGAVPIGVLVGLPALRTRGVNLAVATLGLALLLESQVLANDARTGGVLGIEIGSARFLGINLDTFDHPGRYAALAIVLFLLAFLLVANLRRSRTGRRLVAVRTNERAAAALGVSVFGAKLYAFGLSAALAALGGIIIAFRRPTVTFYPTFAVFESIFVVLYAVIGGIGFPLGAVLGAGLAPGTIGAKIFSLVGEDVEDVFRLFGGILLITVLLKDPDGLVSLYRRLVIRAAAHVRPAWQLADRSTPALSDGMWVRPPPATLEIRDLTVKYGSVTALDAVSLTVAPGEVVGIIGPNGAGKTTLIDAVTGYVTATGGSVLLNDRAIQSWSPRRRAVAGIGRSFQSLELFDSLTVAENLQTACDPRDGRAYFTDLVHPGRPPLTAAAAAAVREFGLKDELASRPDELPYGRRRLVAIARAIAMAPSVLLLDEPAAGLDAEERVELARLIRRLADEWGLAVLVVEHDVSLVLEICERLIVLDFGVKIAEGRPDDVANDATVVASYLGTEVATAQNRVHRTISRDVLLRAEGLSAGYGELAAVRDLDLTVHAGEVIALLGPNGAGKSTTLLALAGELRPLAGRVTYLGRTRSDPLHRRVRDGIAFLPEERSVFDSLTVAANLRIGLGPSEVALGLFPELRPLLGQRVALCSGGEQRILMLARALAARPRLLLVDELSLGLAPLIVQRLLEALRTAADAEGMAVLLVEQHAAYALQVADRVCVLARGRVVMESSSGAVLDDPGSLERAYLRGVRV